MPDLGIDVQLKGQNFIRLLAGLGTALQISMISDRKQENMVEKLLQRELQNRS